MKKPDQPLEFCEVTFSMNFDSIVSFELEQTLQYLHIINCEKQKWNHFPTTKKIQMNHNKVSKNDWVEHTYTLTEFDLTK